MATSPCAAYQSAMPRRNSLTPKISCRTRMPGPWPATGNATYAPNSPPSNDLIVAILDSSSARSFIREVEGIGQPWSAPIELSGDSASFLVWCDLVVSPRSNPNHDHEFTRKLVTRSSTSFRYLLLLPVLYAQPLLSRRAEIHKVAH